MQMDDCVSNSWGLRGVVGFRERRQPVNSAGERSSDLDMETLPAGQLPQILAVLPPNIWNVTTAPIP